ncbi:MAG: hypothetical protein GY757_53235 [bacterium]|nr:hypothetical protein [bacterium]
MTQTGLYLKDLWTKLSSLLNSRKKKLLAIRETWGKKGIGIPDFNLISIYHNLKIKSKTYHTIDDKTWSDLNMDEIFTGVDTCVGVTGKQYLYHLMRTYSRDKNVLDKRFELFDLLRNNKEHREKIQLILKEIDDENDYYIPTLLLEPLPKKPRYFWLLYLSSFLALSSTVLIFLAHFFIFTALVFGILNMGIHLYYSRHTFEHLTSLRCLFRMLAKAGHLAAVEHIENIAPLEKLKKHRKVLKKFAKKFGMFFKHFQTNELGVILKPYLNHFYLYELLIFIRSINMLHHYRDQLLEIFEAVGTLDAAIAAASYIESLTNYIRPGYIHIDSEQNPRKTIEFRDACHPLLDSPVPNSIKLESESIILTGSNMAGKTTFIKTIGVNVILAQTLSICLAKKATIPFLDVKSLIDRKDDLEQGKSYYFVEVEQIRGFIRMSEKQPNYLFLMDEIYRGTNTVERIAASAAVLKFLGTKNTVLATTHDVELQEILKGSYSLFHFSERVSEGNYYFDYKLTPGLCSSGNAIKLLEICQYPQSVTEEAYRLAKPKLAVDSRQ